LTPKEIQLACSGGFDSVQVRTYSVDVTKPSSDKYAVLASIDTTATSINWNGQMNTTLQSGEAPDALLRTFKFLTAVSLTSVYTFLTH